MNEASAVISAIYALQIRRQHEELERVYLGVSGIGEGTHIGLLCERSQWYEFRKALDPEHTPRELRLFETGHREEERIIFELRSAGFEVLEFSKNGSQWEVSDFGGHFKGHLDGLIKIEGHWYLLEIKTSNTSEWKAVAKHGMPDKKKPHYAQIQTYLGYANIQWDHFGVEGEPPQSALYISHCKETDHLYAEFVDGDPDEFKLCRARAGNIIHAMEPPPRIREQALAKSCAHCTFHGICHDAEVPRVDCRTCMHSTPDVENGGWICERFDKQQIPDAFLRKACVEHLYIAPLVEALIGTVESYDNADPSAPVTWVEYRDGEQITINASASSAKRGLSSMEISKLPNNKFPRM